MEFNLLRIQELQPVRKVLDKLVGPRLRQIEKNGGDAPRHRPHRPSEDGRNRKGSAVTRNEQEAKKNKDQWKKTEEKEEPIKQSLSCTYEDTGTPVKLHAKHRRKKGCCVLQ